MIASESIFLLAIHLHTIHLHRKLIMLNNIQALFNKTPSSSVERMTKIESLANKIKKVSTNPKENNAITNIQNVVKQLKQKAQEGGSVSRQDLMEIKKDVKIVKFHAQLTKSKAKSEVKQLDKKYIGWQPGSSSAKLIGTQLNLKESAKINVTNANALLKKL